MTSWLSRVTTASFVYAQAVKTYSGKNQVNGFANLSPTTCDIAIPKLNREDNKRNKDKMALNWPHK